MTDRRHAHTLATPVLTRGDERPAPPCAGRWSTYDALMDHIGGPVLRFAREEAAAMCGACPIQARCHADNAGEDWLRALNREPRPRKVKRAGGGSQRGRHLSDEGRARVAAATGARNAEHAARRNAERAAELSEWVKTTAGPATVAGELGISVNSLREWCRRNGHMDLWAQISRRGVAA